MRKLNPRTRQALAAKEDALVQQAREVAEALWEALDAKQRKDGKGRQLRNILEVAESTDSWKALALFIRYQAARGELDIGWAEKVIETLEGLESEACKLAQDNKDDPKAVHLEMITHLLGHAVRWHLWDVKKGGG
nr:hypothetical protein [Ardenticatena sp.]